MLKIALICTVSVLPASLTLGSDRTVEQSPLDSNHKTSQQKQVAQLRLREQLKIFEQKYREAILNLEKSFEKANAMLEDVKAKQTDPNEIKKIEEVTQNTLLAQEKTLQSLRGTLKLHLTKQRELDELNDRERDRLKRILPDIWPR